MTDKPPRYEVVAGHINGPAIIDMETRSLVLNGLRDSVADIAKALNVLQTIDTDWAIPELDVLSIHELCQVVRIQAKEIQRLNRRPLGTE